MIVLVEETDSRPFNVSTQMPSDLVNLGKNLLPNTSNSEDIVTSTISVPGSSSFHLRLVQIIGYIRIYSFEVVFIK